MFKSNARSVKSFMIFILLAASLICRPTVLFPKNIEVETALTLSILLQEEDTDNDKKITVDDYPVPNTDSFADGIIEVLKYPDDAK